MHRNYVFKPGRGSKLLQQVKGIYNTTNYNADSESLSLEENQQVCRTSTESKQSNISVDIIENTPPSQKPTKKNHKKVTAIALTTVLTSNNNNNIELKVAESISPSLVPSKKSNDPAPASERTAAVTLIYENEFHLDVTESIFPSLVPSDKPNDLATNSEQTSVLISNHNNELQLEVTESVSPSLIPSEKPNDPETTSEKTAALNLSYDNEFELNITENISPLLVPSDKPNDLATNSGRTSVLISNHDNELQLDDTEIVFHSLIPSETPNIIPTTSAKTWVRNSSDSNETIDLEADLYLTDDSANPEWKNSKDEKNKEHDGDDSETEPNIRIKKKIKVSRWHKRREETYDRNKQKALRSQCLPYKDYKKQVKPPKAPKPVDYKCKLKCIDNFSQEDRIKICKTYWGLADYNRQKDFILMNVTAHSPERRLVNVKRKRNVSRRYFFKKEDRRIKVCQKFFTTTLCISNGPINKAFLEVGSLGTFEGEDKRGKHEAHNKTKEEDENYVKEHIESFPRVESHYCRKTSSKQYLDSKLSIPKMFELYEEKCEKDNRLPVSENVYRRIFCTQYNLDFHKPKKDQCLLCHKYKTAKVENSTDLATWQEKYDRHIALRDQSQSAKDNDKIRANRDETFNSITLDLQKVLHMPNSSVSLLYYLRKLNLYNATIYESRSPNDGYCFLWNELNGKKGSDEIGTALFLWIQRLPRNVTEISIFSDTCAGQNRNQYLLCLLLYVVQKTDLQVIEHKYLESGHTQMEVDSMHSAIEHQLSLMPVVSMIDICNVIRLARSNRKAKKKGTILKKPYEPVIMDYTDILDLKDLKNNLMKNRSVGSDGEVVQWLKVKCFRFEKKKPNVVHYRYDYESEYKELNVALKKGVSEKVMEKKNLRKRKLVESDNLFDYDNYILKKAYDQMLPTTKAKKRDLMKMCAEKIIPPELHHWYKNIPEKEGRDYLPDEDTSAAEDDS